MSPSPAGCGHPHTVPLSSFVDDTVTSSTSESSALSRKRFTLQGFANLKGQKGKRHPPAIRAVDVSLTVVACLSSIRVVLIRVDGCGITTCSRPALPTEPRVLLALACPWHTQPTFCRWGLWFKKAEAGFSSEGLFRKWSCHLLFLVQLLPHHPPLSCSVLFVLMGVTLLHGTPVLVSPVSRAGR